MYIMGPPGYLFVSRLGRPFGRLGFDGVPGTAGELQRRERSFQFVTLSSEWQGTSMSMQSRTVWKRRFPLVCQ